MSDRRLVIAVPLLIGSLGLTAAALLMKDLTVAGWAVALAVIGNALAWVGGDDDADDL